jgi:hypothetical protein
MNVRRIAIITATLVAAALGGLMTLGKEQMTETTPAGAQRIRLAVLGDSDSHAYQDRILIPASPAKRGGTLRASTWQWTEALARLREGNFDQGAWSDWGTLSRIGAVKAWLGLDARAPKKQDYQYNFAISGARCDDLMGGDFREAHHLVQLMDREPAAWRDGIVVIRIGVNSIGQFVALNQFAQEGASPAVRATIMPCVTAIRDATGLIRQHHPHTRIVLVGIFDNAHWPRFHQHWRTAAERSKIAAALDLFDDALKAIAKDDAGIAFFDDRAWFRHHWGDRDEAAGSAYRQVSLGGKRAITNTAGDEPFNAVLADGHAGTVWNALWAQRFVEVTNAAFGLNVPPITVDEIARLADGEGAWGIRPANR